MARIIAVVNQKGGVGKTTTAINLGASVAASGLRVLLVDVDPQGNASSGIGYPNARVELSVYPALIGEVDFGDCIRPTDITTLFVAPANADLYGAEIELATMDRRELMLQRCLESVREQFDYIIIDCPPSLGLLTLNALVACDSVVVPMQAEYFSLEGLGGLTHTIEHVKKSLNPKLEVEGVLFCMYDPRTRLASAVKDEVAGHFGDKVYDTIIPRNVRLSESPSHGKPILLYDLRSRGCQSYLQFAREFIARQGHVRIGAQPDTMST